MQEQRVSLEMVHHGAAASSSAHSVVWIPSSDDHNNSLVVYSSHGLLNIATLETVVLGTQQQEVWNTTTSLCTATVGSDVSTKRVISCLAHVRPAVQNSSNYVCIATGFSDGTVNTWTKQQDNQDDWKEHVVVQPPSEKNGQHAITDMDGLLMNDNVVFLVTCSSDGAFLLQQHGNKEEPKRLASFCANTVRLEQMVSLDKIIILVGTAHPRHNKIHVYTMNCSSTGSDDVHHCGHLSGHQDWITCLDWNMNEKTIPMLASGSQDAKIRLWRFTTVSTTSSSSNHQEDVLPTVSDDEDSDLDSLSDDNDEGEARLEILNEKSITSVTLEALLLGHEESVTSVHWHPNPQRYYGQAHILMSSSMDRTILIWGPTSDAGGVWTPLTRVGSAGGILGGSIGSSLLGFVNCQVEPVRGSRLLGHAYGGALHFWSLESSSHDKESCITLSMDEMAAQNKWKATPCLTGHFEGVTDLCWEAESGDYLLTVSMDQTCRLWGTVSTTSKKDVWIELARPQVHGYDLNAIASVSTVQHKHLMASGADEKELRVFDAPLTTTNILRAASGIVDDSNVESGDSSRVERAYIPSLGLSNKATAVESAEEDTGGIDDNGSSSQDKSFHLPLERDLGVMSLWPEVRKLFGHNTELFCLASTVSARSGAKYSSSPFARDVLVASSAKARDVEAASIRIWDIEKGTCVQVLKGGHRSTVATLSFSPDGRYLASSGKDRRLCLWKRDEPRLDCPPSFSLASAIDSAHKRIIWSVHFCPHDPCIFASGSRDGCVKIWKVTEAPSQDDDGAKTTQLKTLNSFEPETKIGKRADSVTALSFAPWLVTTSANKSCAVLALGLESGIIELWSVPLSDKSVGEGKPVVCRNILCTPRHESHCATITKLAWKPINNREDNDGKSQKDSAMLLASASADHGCRLWRMAFS